MLCAICYHFYNLKNVKNKHGGVLLLVKLLASTKGNSSPCFWGVFSRFFHCTNGPKSRKASHITIGYFLVIFEHRQDNLPERSGTPSNLKTFCFKSNWVSPSYQGVRNISFTENLACFVVFLLPFWDSTFCLLLTIYGHKHNECITRQMNGDNHRGDNHI